MSILCCICILYRVFELHSRKVYWHFLGNWEFVASNLIWVRLLGHNSLNLDSCLEFQNFFIIPLLFWKVLKYSQESLMFVLRNAPKKACKIQLGLMNFIKHLSLESWCSNCESVIGIWWLWQNFNTHVVCIDMKCFQLGILLIFRCLVVKLKIATYFWHLARNKKS